MNIKIFVCDNSIEGIFTAIYQAWSSGNGHANNKIQEQGDANQYTTMELFAEYITVETNMELVNKVAQSVKNKISEEVYHMISNVALSNYQGKADLVYRFMILGFAMGNKVIDDLSNDVVNKIFKISRNVSNEAHHMMGFLRFSEYERGLLVSVIHPKNNIISLITPHFVDRLPDEKFIIYDETRGLAVIHLPNKSAFLIHIDDNNMIRDSFKIKSDMEDEYKQLWNSFFNSIAIKERLNPKLQRNLLPLRYRKDMTEFL